VADIPSAPTWRERVAGLRGRTHGAGLFAAGVLAALVALLLANRLFPADPPLTLRDVNDALAAAAASATPARPARRLCTR
jgi:hypothetical protein